MQTEYKPALQQIYKLKNFMNKKILIILAILLIVTGLLVIFVFKADNSSENYTTFRNEYKNSDIKVLDNYTSLTRAVELKLSDKKYWQGLNDMNGGKTTYPKPTLESDTASKLEIEAKKMEEIKVKFDPIVCDKVKAEDKTDCNKIKANFESNKAKYSDLITKVKAF
jgi:hypothetical protein